MAIEHTFRVAWDEGKGKEIFATKRLTPIKAIAAHCLECVAFVRIEVERCTSPKCALYPFRLGETHSGKVVTEAQREHGRRMAENLVSRAKSRKGK